jgi:hypothetical protein
MVRGELKVDPHPKTLRTPALDRPTGFHLLHVRTKSFMPTVIHATARFFEKSDSMRGRVENIALLLEGLTHFETFCIICTSNDCSKILPLHVCLN